MIFANGKDVPLNARAGTMPDVSGALLDWFAPLTFGVVTKTTVNFQVVETMVETDTQGVWQPMSDRALMMKPEGQRKWKWFTLHCLLGLRLTPDQVVIYLGEQYRVMAVGDWSLNGYMKYELINDYTGAGPTVVTP